MACAWLVPLPPPHGRAAGALQVGRTVPAGSNRQGAVLLAHSNAALSITSRTDFWCDAATLCYRNYACPLSPPHVATIRCCAAFCRTGGSSCSRYGSSSAMTRPWCMRSAIQLQSRSGGQQRNEMGAAQVAILCPSALLCSAVPLACWLAIVVTGTGAGAAGHRPQQRIEQHAHT